MEPAARRAIEQMPGIREYFLTFLPAAEKSKPPKERLTEKKPYLRIVQYLKSPTSISELRFVVSSAKMFSGFVKLFQRDEPLIHVLYTELYELVKKMEGRVCTQKAIKKHGCTKTTVLDEKNRLPLSDMMEKCDTTLSAELKQVMEWRIVNSVE